MLLLYKCLRRRWSPLGPIKIWFRGRHLRSAIETNSLLRPLHPGPVVGLNSGVSVIRRRFLLRNGLLQILTHKPKQTCHVQLNNDRLYTVSKENSTEHKSFQEREQKLVQVRSQTGFKTRAQLHLPVLISINTKKHITNKTTVTQNSLSSMLAVVYRDLNSEPAKAQRHLLLLLFLLQ